MYVSPPYANFPQYCIGNFHKSWSFGIEEVTVDCLSRLNSALTYISAYLFHKCWPSGGILTAHGLCQLWSMSLTGLISSLLLRRLNTMSHNDLFLLLSPLLLLLLGMQTLFFFHVLFLFWLIHDQDEMEHKGRDEEEDTLVPYRVSLLRRFIPPLCWGEGIEIWRGRQSIGRICCLSLFKETRAAVFEVVALKHHMFSFWLTFNNVVDLKGGLSKIVNTTVYVLHSWYMCRWRKSNILQKCYAFSPLRGNQAVFSIISLPLLERQTRLWFLSHTLQEHHHSKSISSNVLHSFSEVDSAIVVSREPSLHHFQTVMFFLQWQNQNSI